MKLFELRDISDYRKGDENDPRSPYYEDPFEDGIPEEFYPEMPSFDVKVESGKAPNGEAYNFVILSSYDKTDKKQYGIWEVALDKLAGDKRFAACELVDQKDGDNGNNRVWYDYYQAGEGFPVQEVKATLIKYAEEYAAEIAERDAYETFSRDGRDWNRPDDY